MTEEQALKKEEVRQLNIDGAMHRFFTEEDLDNCWAYYKRYLVEILNGTYDLKDARSDLASLIGTQWDSRNGTETLS